MVEFKLVISDSKTGKSKQIVLNDQQSKLMFGKKIGETFKGELLDMTGYEFEITGGSDKSGFPMRKDLPGTLRKKILAVSGVGVKRARKGQRQRKTVSGNTIFEKTIQINVKVLKAGKVNIFEEPKAETETSAEGDVKPEEKKVEAVPEKKE